MNYKHSKQKVKGQGQQVNLLRFLKLSLLLIWWLWCISRRRLFLY